MLRSFYRLWLQLACFYCLDPVFTHLYVRLVTGAAESAAVKLRISAFQLLLSQEQTYFDKHRYEQTERSRTGF